MCVGWAPSLTRLAPSARRSRDHLTAAKGAIIATSSPMRGGSVDPMRWGPLFLSFVGPLRCHQTWPFAFKRTVSLKCLVSSSPVGQSIRRRIAIQLAPSPKASGLGPPLVENEDADKTMSRGSSGHD